MISTPPPITLTGAVGAGYSAAKTAILGEAPKSAPPDVSPVPAASGRAPQEAALRRTRSSASLTVVPVRNSRMVELRFTSTEPQLAADMANALAKAYIQQNLETRVLRLEGRDRLAVRARSPSSARRSRRAKPRSSATRSSTTPSPSRIARTSSCSASARPERRGHQGEDRRASRRKRCTTSSRPCRARRPIDTFPAVLANDYVQKMKSDLGDLQRQQAQLADKYGDRHPEMVKIRTAIQSTAGQVRQIEINKIVDSVQSRVPVGAGAGTQPGRRARQPEVRGAQPEPQGHRIQRSAARGREQPADLRVAAAAHEGDRDLGRAQGEQRSAWSTPPRCRSRRSAAPRNETISLAGSAGSAPRASASCSSSSTSTTASSRRRSCARR